MKLEIHSFESIQNRARTPFEQHTSLISIGDPDAPPPELKYRPDHILRLVFDDITPAEINERFHDLPDYDVILFDDQKARQIARFVMKYHAETDILICQCEYGQSRSAGCAAAISEYFYGNGIDIFADERYFPNRYVYHKLMNAMSSLQ